MQYKILASDYDNTLVPFGESQPRPAMVPASWTRTVPSWQSTP